MDLTLPPWNRILSVKNNKSFGALVVVCQETELSMGYAGTGIYFLIYYLFWFYVLLYFVFSQFILT